MICPDRCSSNVCCIFSITREFQILSHDQNPADNLLVCRIPLVLLLQIPMQHSRRFCARRKSDRIDPIIACAAYNSCFICPYQRLARIAAHAGRVREAVKRRSRCGALAAIAAVAVQDCRKLLSCDCIIRCKSSVAETVDNAVFRCPRDRFGIVSTRRNILEFRCLYALSQSPPGARESLQSSLWLFSDPGQTLY